MRPTFTTMAICTTAMALAQWEPRPSSTTRFLRDITFATPDLGFAVGDSGIIVRTQDAGETWSVVFNDGISDLHAVHFASATLGFAAGDFFATGVILRTMDAGMTWAPCFSGSWQQFRSIHFSDTLNGFVGSGQWAMRTLDGGNTWITMPDLSNLELVTAISFPSATVGYFIGGSDYSDQLWKTTDGGLTVQPITNGFQSIKECAQFFNDSVGYMGGWYSPMIARTDDGGLSWTEVGGGQSAWDMHFVNVNEGRIVQWGGGWGSILRTVDGCATWITEYDEPNVQLEALHMVSDQLGFACGSNGLILKTTNGGAGVHDAARPASAMIVSPNPSNGLVALFSPAFGNKRVLSIGIEDGSGRRLAQVSATSDQGKVELHLPSVMSNGSYTATVRDAAGPLGSAPFTLMR